VQLQERIAKGNNCATIDCIAVFGLAFPSMQSKAQWRKEQNGLIRRKVAL